MLILCTLTVYSAEQKEIKEKEEKHREAKEREEKHAAQQPAASEQLFTLQTTLNNQHYVSSIVFDPENDAALAVGSAGSSVVTFWDITSGKITHTLKNTNPTSAIVFNPTNKIFFVGLSNGNLTAYRRLSAKKYQPPLTTLKGIGHINALAFSRPEQVLAIASNDKDIRLFRAQLHNRVSMLQGHKGPVTALAFHPRHALLASGSEDQTINLWNLTATTPIATFTGHTNTITSVDFSSIRPVIASGSKDGTIRLWHIGTGKNIRTLKGHKSYVNVVTFHPNGWLLASGSYDGEIRFWNVITSKLLATLKTHDSPITTLTFNSNRPLAGDQTFGRGSLLVSGSSDGIIKIWKAIDLNKLQKIDPKTRTAFVEEVEKEIQDLMQAGHTPKTNAVLAQLESEYPRFFNPIRTKYDQQLIRNATTCAICLTNFEPKETVAIPERCNHPFHKECIAGVLNTFPKYPSEKTTQHCPICRSVIREFDYHYNPVTRVRDVIPDEPQLRYVTMEESLPQNTSASSSQTTAGPVIINAEQDQLIRERILKLLNTEERSAEDEENLKKLHAQYPELYQQAYEEHAPFLTKK